MIDIPCFVPFWLSVYGKSFPYFKEVLTLASILFFGAYFTSYILNNAGSLWYSIYRIEAEAGQRTADPEFEISRHILSSHSRDILAHSRNTRTDATLKLMRISPSTVALSTGIVVLAGLLAYGYSKYHELSLTYLATSSSLASSTSGYETLAQTSVRLRTELEAEQAKNGTFASQISSITNTVGTLDKLAKTDKELLAKYSKIYFLSEHYVPTSLSAIGADYVYPAGKQERIATAVEPFLSDLLQHATGDAVDIRITSAYRSFTSQASLKTNYKLTYGTGANAFSADQGYSEHQLGTTIDFTTAGTKGALVGFDKTPASVWLLAHAYEYGFILSYPKGNGYYQYEPWHWRFVGVPLATRLHQDQQNFYTLDQREIDTYLATLFDR